MQGSISLKRLLEVVFEDEPERGERIYENIQTEIAETLEADYQRFLANPHMTKQEYIDGEPDTWREAMQNHMTDEQWESIQQHWRRRKMRELINSIWERKEACDDGETH